MKRRNKELDVDFIGGAEPLTKEEEEKISTILKSHKTKQKTTSQKQKRRVTGQRQCLIPIFAIVGRDHISIMLKEIALDVKAIPNHSRHEWARWDAYIYTVEPDTLFDEYRSNGIVFRQPIQDDDDGLRGFEVI